MRKELTAVYPGSFDPLTNGHLDIIEKASKINDSDIRANYLTSYCNDMQNKAFEDGKQILNDVIWTKNKNSNTFKIERNPETHQMTGKQVVIPPMNITHDASKYKYVPSAQ